MELLGQGGVFVEQRQALVHPLLDHMEMRVHLRNPNISSVKVSHSWVHGAYRVRASELGASELSHLEFHLLSLLGVNGHNMLVMRERVSAVLLLNCHVSLQGLQHVLRLQDKVGQRTDSVSLIHNAANHSETLTRLANLWTHLRWIGLHCREIVLQGQPAVVVEYGLHSDQMGLHQPLPLSGDLLLQRLQHRLEVLVGEGGVKLGLLFIHVLISLVNKKYLIQGLSLCLGQVFGLVVCFCPFLHDLRCKKKLLLAHV